MDWWSEMSSSVAGSMCPMVEASYLSSVAWEYCRREMDVPLFNICYHPDLMRGHPVNALAWPSAGCLG
jgi:hypothetical protein